MRSIGIVRKVDELGRIVIPVELRRNLDIAERDPLEIYVNGEAIILQKHRPYCVFCGGVEEVGEFKGKNVCQQCIREAKEVRS
ncbi:MAG: AbrB/MazE/SpoVT family DNA-binding domain-containing protein [Firmicutes bacterium]|nr:AbrB/MazE/SpoVT family DNA-binding domain-containing protein [Bacillota bacterium]